MKQKQVKKETKEMSAAVGRALRRAAKVARKTARMYGTPIQLSSDHNNEGSSSNIGLTTGCGRARDDA
jgi:hypothetical protein